MPCKSPSNCSLAGHEAKNPGLTIPRPTRYMRSMPKVWLSENDSPGSTTAVLLGPVEETVISEQCAKHHAGVLWITAEEETDPPQEPPANLSHIRVGPDAGSCHCRVNSEPGPGSARPRTLGPGGFMDSQSQPRNSRARTNCIHVFPNTGPHFQNQDWTYEALSRSVGEILSVGTPLWQIETFP